jgi:hypothetical protein
MLHHLQHLWRSREPTEFIRYHLEHGKRVDYLKLASRCETQNLFNRLHIELENICAPLELVGIAKLPKSDLPPPTRKWLRQLKKWEPDLFDAPQRYERRVFSWPMVLYQNPEHDVREKGLLVAFSCNARRLMMPIWLFLQFVDSSRWDVVVLKKSGHSYLTGMEGISTDFPGLVAHVEAAIRPTQYRRVITLGTSGGGFAAIWAALLMGADRGISVCGCPPISLPPSMEDPRAPHEVDLWFVYGGAQEQDHRSALALLDLFGGRLRPVPGVDKHTLFGPLLRRDQFGEFLNEMLA